MCAMPSRRVLRALVAAGSFALLSACGGGGGTEAPAPPASPPAALGAPPITRVIVAGDSLADVGTFGFKATVQSASSPATGYPIYPEIVARDLGVGVPCNHFASSDKGTTFTTRAGCTGFAVAGASIVNPITQGGDAVPFSVQHQLAVAASANGGAWRPGDLVVVDAGGNDAAGLATTYLGARYGTAADQAVYVALLGQQLRGSTVTQALAQANGGSVAANLYMQELARTFWTALKASTLDKGATRVAVVNVPDITRTPRFRKGITAGVATDHGAAAAADFEAQVRGWIATFNSELAKQAAGDSRVVVVDYFSAFTSQNATPGAFGLTNANEAACPLNADFPQCTDAALDAAPPAGSSAGWWKTWLYSDRFHPSPRGHELLAGVVEQAVRVAGWR